MAIANGTCVSFCNQPKAHFGLPWVRPWDNRGKCHMNKKRFQCLSNALQHVPSIFNRFPVFQPVSSKVRHFSIFFAHFGLPWVRPGTIAVSVTWMERWFNAGQTHSSIPIYFQPFTIYSEILVGNGNFFPTPLHLTPPLGCFHWNSEKKLGPRKTRIMGLPGSGDSLTIGWAVSTQYTSVWRTDRQMDRQTDSLYQ